MFDILRALIAAFIVAQLATVVTTVYLHRALAHRSVHLHRSVTFACRVITWLTVGIRPRQWAAVHRKHHAFTDQPEDPHSPIQLGWLRVQLANAALYRKAAKDPSTISRYARDIPEDEWDRRLFNHGLIGVGIGIAGLVVVLGPWYGLVAAAIHTVFYLAIGGAINGLGHHFGRRPYENSATNMQWLAFFTGGEGLHNNHHAAPTSARFSLHRGEIDFGWWVVAILQRFKLARVRLDRVVLKRPPARTAA
jgi:stearoyl-CoA desaturase (delta-9 desaturase)